MSTQIEPNSTPKYEVFVEQQLARARGRIRALDVTALLLLLASVTLGYAVLMGVLDRAWQLPSWLRLVAFAAFVAIMVYLIGMSAVRIFFLRINPYYAARCLEETVPDAKNSVVNWIDLRGEKLPPAIRNSLGLRAAKDLAQTDPEKAIANRQTLVLGGVVAGLFFAVVIAFLLWGPVTFVSLLQRNFAPFSEIAIATRSNLELLQPSDGDVMVLVNQKVDFRVQVTGRVPRPNQPDSVRLHYRYNQNDPYVQQPLEQDADGDWVTTILGDQVHNGFWYKVTAGDASTPEYQVKVRSLAQVTRFDVTYKFRPYRKEADLSVSYPNEISTQPHLKALRGTEVTLLAHANRDLKEARIEFDQGGVKKAIAGDLIPDDPKTARFQFVLDQDGTYRVLFTSREGEPNSDRFSYDLSVLNDQAPVVQLTVPGKDVQMPANGTLALEGRADDDSGIRSMTLHLRVAKADTQPTLEPKVYRPGKSLELKNGKYPEQLLYKDFVALEKIKTSAGEAFPLAPGMEIEYWLEAVDNCDYPDPAGNVGRSKTYKVTITPPERDKEKQQQERQKTEEQQRQHEANQDQDLKKRGEKSNPQPQSGNEQKTPSNPDQKTRTEEQNNTKPNSADQGSSKKENDSAQNQDLQQKSEQLKKELDEQSKKENAKGETKSESPSQAQKKDGPKSDASASKPKEKSGSSDQACNNKDAGSGKGTQGEAKGKGKEQGNSDTGEPAQAKNEGDKGSSREGQGTAKAGADPSKSSDTEPSANKSPPGDKSSAAKERGKGDSKTNPSQAKEKSSADSSGQQMARDQQPGMTKEQSPQTTKGEQKPAGDKQSTDAAQGKAKASGSQGNDPKTAKAGEKTGPKDSAQQVAQGKGDPRDKDGAGAGPGQEMSKKELDKLKNGLRSNDVNERNAAAEKLARMREQAKDPQTRDAVDKALKEAGRDAKSGDEVAHTKEKQGEGSKLAQGDRKGPGSTEPTPKDAGDAKGAKPDTANSASAKRGEGKNDVGKAQAKGQEGYGGNSKSGEATDPATTEINPDYARRAGELQLEDLKKVTPDMLKKLNWTDQEFSEFRKALEARRQSDQVAKPSEDPLRVQKGSGLFGPQGARKIGQGTASKQSGSDYAQPRPPAEFQEAQRIFTSVPPPEKK
jgi:collagen type III alpha